MASHQERCGWPGDRLINAQFRSGAAVLPVMDTELMVVCGFSGETATRTATGTEPSAPAFRLPGRTPVPALASQPRRRYASSIRVMSPLAHWRLKALFDTHQSLDGLGGNSRVCRWMAMTPRSTVYPRRTANVMSGSLSVLLRVKGRFHPCSPARGSPDDAGWQEVFEKIFFGQNFAGDRGTSSSAAIRAPGSPVNSTRTVGP